jgi:Fur family ferric uptake transcriptional regulator
MSVCQRRNTRQRQVVLDELRRDVSHPTAAQLFARVRERLPHISLGTVYRNLDILQETGDCQRLCGSGGNEAHFDGRTEPHLHLQCRECGTIHDLDTMLPLLDGMVGASVEGHQVEGYSLILRGVCRSCRG